MSLDLTNETIEAFSWLESKIRFEREVMQYEDTTFIKKIIYKEKNYITVSFICDNRENDFYFEIFIRKGENNYSITEYLSSNKRQHQIVGLHNVKYERIFEYTLNAYSEEQFQNKKNEMLYRKKLNIKEYVGLYNELLKVAIPNIIKKFS